MVPLLIFCFLTSACLGAPTKSYQVPIPTHGTCAYDGLTMADPQDSLAYYQCCKNLWLPKFCVEGEVFDKIKLICVPNDVPPPPPVPINHHHHPSTTSM
ncbi:hypothetical protein GCK72_000812 [Caenorhabditis remanei]|uniref:Chitin-binding type-2 domain-containing protein n=1 Tax=Caenorhabditis remanei TaxID=31234 RepID=A0A6A5HMY0_CAERE|nr:hypothetical protein GCK72_000812 [Caenorhabditis remanei]KAF1768999.1 hypothetical protein GCK72_000812 [Caenorhabditis remanei]